MICTGCGRYAANGFRLLVGRRYVFVCKLRCIPAALVVAKRRKAA